MNTNIIVALDTRRKKKDGLYPIILRLGHKRTTTAIPLGFHINEKDWDDNNRLIKKNKQNEQSVTRLNNLIYKKKTDAMSVILKLHEAGELDAMSVTDIKDKIYKPAIHTSFIVFTEEQIKGLKKANRIGTARSYKDVLAVVKNYWGKDKHLPFKAINYNFLTKFETAHYAKGNTTNGLAVYMRTIRAIYNKAIKAGVIEKELYPFDEYKIKTAPTAKRAIEWELLKKIIDYVITPDHECFNTRNYFIASYMMYGMNFTDMAFLKKSDVIDGRIRYRRRKTSKLYDIKVSDSLNSILQHYVGQLESEYVFPIVKRDSALLQYRDIEWARKRYNKKLKKLAGLCGIEENLTSYVSRHSFATQAMILQVPLNAISTMLGHSSLKTTETYLKSLPSNIIDNYNDRILQGG